MTNPTGPLTDDELSWLSVKAPGDLEDVEEGRELVPFIHRMVDEIRNLREGSATERLEARRAQARANEAARLSAAARDEVADRDKVIADLRERVSIVEESRMDLAAWAVRFATKYHASYREHSGGMDPFEAIEEALALIPDLQDNAKSAELTRTRAQDALESAQAAIHKLVTVGVRNEEIHRRSALPLLEAAGFTGDEARDIVHAAEEES